MKPVVPQDLLRQATHWEQLHRWQRSELGKALRRLGLTYREIREIIPVPKSTLSNWCRDVALTTYQVEEIKRRGSRQPGVPRDTQAKRRAEISAIQQLSRRRAGGLIQDPLFAAGVALYWAEGSKTQSDLALANTDPALLRIFVGWVRVYLDPAAEFRLSLHLHAGNNEQAAMRYWRTALSLPTARFTKTYLKPPGTGHRKNRLEQGVCRVRVCRSADFWHTTMAWIEYMRSHTPSTIATLAPGR